MLIPNTQGSRADLYPDIYNYGYRDQDFTENSDFTQYTFSNVGIGTAAADRTVVVVVGAHGTTGSLDTPTVQLNGVTMNFKRRGRNNSGDGNYMYAGVFFLAAPTGTTAAINVDFGATDPVVELAIATYSFQGGTDSNSGARVERSPSGDTSPLNSLDPAEEHPLFAVAATFTEDVQVTDWDSHSQDYSRSIGSDCYFQVASEYVPSGSASFVFGYTTYGSSWAIPLVSVRFY